MLYESQVDVAEENEISRARIEMGPGPAVPRFNGGRTDSRPGSTN